MEPQRDVYGEAPPTLLFVLTALAAILTVLLFVLGHWVLGLVALAACVLLAAAFATSNRRVTPRLRERAMYGAMAVLTWVQAWNRALRAYGEAHRLQRQRAVALRVLGEATHRGDEAAAEWARQQLAWLDSRLQGR